MPQQGLFGLSHVPDKPEKKKVGRPRKPKESEQVVEQQGGEQVIEQVEECPAPAKRRSGGRVEMLERANQTLLERVAQLEA